MASATGAGIFTFRILPDDDEIDVSGLLAFQGTLHPGQQVSRTQADVLVELQPYPYEQAVQGNMVRYPVGKPHGPEIDGIERPEDIHAVFRHHGADGGLRAL